MFFDSFPKALEVRSEKPRIGSKLKPCANKSCCCLDASRSHEIDRNLVSFVHLIGCPMTRQVWTSFSNPVYRSSTTVHERGEHEIEVPPRNNDQAFNWLSR